MGFIPFQGTVIKVVLAGGLIAVAAFGSSKLGLGDKVKDAALGLGEAGGSLITQPIAGLTDALTQGINDITANARNLFGSLGIAGADVQEAFTGNRDAIKDYFDGDERPDERQESIPINDELPPIEDFAKDIFKTLNPGKISNETLRDSGSFGEFVKEIFRISNPEDSPSVGFYTITQNGSKLGTFALSEAAIKMHRDAGNTVTRVG